MASYKDRILKAIEESREGLTTVDVAKRAGVSKTTVIKYLSVLRSEGRVEFAEVGPSKLWKVKRAPEEKGLPPEISEDLPLVDVDLCGDGSGEKTVFLSFRVKPDQICALMRRAKRCVCT